MQCRSGLIMEARAAIQISIILLSHIYFLMLFMTSIVVDGSPQGSGASSRNAAINGVQSEHTVMQRGWLVGRNQMCLEVLDNGTVRGTLNKSSRYALLELRSYNASLKRLYGVKSGRFVAVKKSGRVHATKKIRNNSLLLLYHEKNSYSTFRFPTYKPKNSSFGFLAIKGNGKVIRVHTVLPGHESAQFLFVPQ